MASPWAAQAQLSNERRAFGRARTDCPVRLQTPTRDMHGRLWDLSESGARVQIDNPPESGDIILLKWLKFDALTRVVWSSEDMCGLSFERPLDRAIVAQTIGEDAPEPGPTASFGNIPVGQRRSRLRSVDEA